MKNIDLKQVVKRARENLFANEEIKDMSLTQEAISKKCKIFKIERFYYYYALCFFYKHTTVPFLEIQDNLLDELYNNDFLPNNLNDLNLIYNHVYNGIVGMHQDELDTCRTFVRNVEKALYEKPKYRNLKSFTIKDYDGRDKDAFLRFANSDGKEIRLNEFTEDEKVIQIISILHGVYQSEISIEDIKRNAILEEFYSNWDLGIEDYMVALGNAKRLEEINIDSNENYFFDNLNEQLPNKDEMKELKIKSINDKIEIRDIAENLYKLLLKYEIMFDTDDCDKPIQNNCITKELIERYSDESYLAKELISLRWYCATGNYRIGL